LEKKESNFGKKRKKKGEKLEKCKKKKRGKNIVDYCCNPQLFRYGGIVIPPHHLDIVIIYGFRSCTSMQEIEKVEKREKVWKGD